MFEKLYALGINDAMITSSVLTLILCIFAILVGRNLQMMPSGMQNVVELAVEKLHGFFEDLMGPYLCKKYFPLVGTLFVWILICNYSGLLPLMGKAHGMQAPTSNINFPLGMAIVVFLALQIIGVIEHRSVVKAYKRLVSPFFFMLPLMLIDEFARPLSLTFRLYGNTFGDEEVVHIFGDLCPIGLPVIMQFMVVLFALIQALVFSLLTAIYIEEVCEGAHEEGLMEPVEA
ncbi:MAG: F0F1 ATP synthase subunit A [Firmicutes bacterium]|nr:F0F1 ATP synthase subunit A [Bacillota bacterium]